MTKPCFEPDDRAEACLKVNEELGMSERLIKLESAKVNSFRL